MITEEPQVFSERPKSYKFRVIYEVRFSERIDGQSYNKGLRGEMVRTAYSAEEAGLAVKRFLETTKYFPYLVDGELCLFNPPRPAEYIQIESSTREVLVTAELYTKDQVIEGQRSKMLE